MENRKLADYLFGNSLNITIDFRFPYNEWNIFDVYKFFNEDITEKRFTTFKEMGEQTDIIEF